MFAKSYLVALTAFAASAYAHINVSNPPPFRGKSNPNPGVNVDFDMVSPLSGSGSNFPCKGYQSDVGTPAGAPTVTYAPGQQATFTLEGGAAHNGGSCQVSLSFDNGASWKVIKSFIGNCVRTVGGNSPDPNQTYDFTIPNDVRAGDALWAWTWFNKVGNREMYMNCAAVTISGSGTSTLNNFPDMFVANVGNGCTVPEGADVEFPNPGADVARAGGGSPPTGNCAAGGGPGVAPPPAAPAPQPEVPAPAPDVPSPAPAPEVPVPENPAPAPPTGGLTHTVAFGEFCSTIAAANGITLARLFANNPTINAGCSNLQPGQVLNLRRRSRVMRRFVSQK